MKQSRNLLKLFLLALLCLALIAGCRKKEEGTPQLPLVTIAVDGQERQFRVAVETVGELLDEAGIELGDLDLVEPAPYTAITDGMVVTVVRVTHETVAVEQVVPFDEQTVYDKTVPPDESRIIEAGQNGLEQLIYRVVYHDGAEVERVQVRRVTLQEAKPRTMLVGVRDTFTPTPVEGTIAYRAGNKEVGYNAWVMRSSSGSQRRLTFDGSLDPRVFALSPDGTQLLFTRHTTDTDHLNNLWLLDTTLVGAEPEDLDLMDVLWADWSPDGETIAYSTGEVAVAAPGWQAHNDLWTARLNSRFNLVRRRQVIQEMAGGAYGWWGTSYAWSPDGRYIAYAQADSVGFVRLYDGRRTELQNFPPFRTYSQWVWVPQPSWSPDSRFLSSILHGPSLTGGPPEDSPVFDLWVFDIERPLAVKQANEAGMWAAPAWSPGYTETVEGPRQSQVAFGRARSPYDSANSPYDLYVMDRDGSNRQRIYPPEGDLGIKSPHLTWGPTGRQLVALHQNDLFLIDLVQDTSRRLTVDGNVQYVDWTQ